MADDEKKVSLVLNGNPEGAVNALNLLRSTATETTTGISNTFTALLGPMGSVAAMAGTFMGILAGGVAKAAIDTTKNVTGEVQKLSKTLGMTAEEASVLRIALDDAFLTVEDITGGTGRLTKQLLGNEDAFRKLGVQTRDNHGNYRDTFSIMMDVNSALSKLKEGTDQNVAGMSIYGKSWNEVRGLLRLNNEAMEEAKQRAEDLNLVFGEQGLKEVKAYKLAMKDLEDVTESLQVQIGRELIPALTDLAVAFGDAGVSGTKFFAGIIKGMKEARDQYKREGSGGLGNFLVPFGSMNKDWRDMSDMTMDGIPYIPPSTRPPKPPLPPGFSDKEKGKQQLFTPMPAKAWTEIMDAGKAAWAEIVSQDLGAFPAGPTDVSSINWADPDSEWNKQGMLSIAQQARLDGRIRSGAQSRINEAGARQGARFAGMADDTGMEAKRQRMQEEQDMWINSWAMQTDSYEVYEQRKSQIDAVYSAKRKQLAMQEHQQKLGYASSGFQSMGSIAESFYTLSNKKARWAFEAAKVMKIGETVTNTASAAMGAYNAMAGIPIIGPGLGVAAATAAIMAGAAQIATIKRQTPDGGGMPSDIASGGQSYGGGTPTSPIVTQPQSTQQQPLNITVQIHGNVLAEDRWIEERLAPTIRDLALNRNVDFGMQVQSI